MIAILSMFFAGTEGGFRSSVFSAVLLTCLILIGVCTTLIMTNLLSHTLLKGIPSSFTLELPPYRKPQFGKILIRSILDRTLFVLGRAAAVAAPAGLLIWLMANIMVQGNSLLTICASFLNPFAAFFGMDGVILLAFILGFPANEIVIPIIIMAYTAQSSLVEMSSLSQMHSLFISHGWTPVTALCTLLFSLMHWPCSTTLLTIKKETKSFKWTALAFLIPALSGLLVCFVVSHIAAFFY